MLAIIDNSTAVFRIAIFLVSLIVVCIACMALVLWVRKWVRDAGPAPRQMGFTLSDLRQMHRDGQLSTEEFERAKEKIVATARHNLLATGKPDPAAGPRARSGPPVSPDEPADPDTDGAEG
jgi:hypothetical protein